MINLYHIGRFGHAVTLEILRYMLTTDLELSQSGQDIKQRVCLRLSGPSRVIWALLAMLQPGSCKALSVSYRPFWLVGHAVTIKFLRYMLTTDLELA